jgi:hypothetical protein
MNEVKSLHVPMWQLSGTEWHLIVGNRSVAKVVPNFDRNCSRHRWLSVIDGDYDAHGWHAVDFETVDTAKHDIEQWWSHMCRGEAFRS